MSQSLFSAMFKGPTEPEGARKVIKFVAYYGFIAVAFGIAILFFPFEPLQAAIGEKIGTKWVLVAAAAISYICFYFLLKEKLWAPSLLFALEIIDFILNYMETGKFFDSFSGVAFIFYGAAIQSTYYLKKKSISSESELETEHNND
jgi:hypothetical protein